MGWLRVAVLVVLTAVAVKKIPEWMDFPTEMLIHGTTEKGWESVKEAFKEVLKTHLDYGYNFAVYHKGKKVVDLYGGYADYSIREPYKENTPTSMFASATTLGALCLAMLADRGLLDYKEKVSHYWPEFAANGKESITVETLLSHQAGLYTISEGYSLETILDDPDTLSRKLAEQKPFWEPGTLHGYHAIAIGLYMKELVKRIDHKQRTLWEFFDEEFAKPLDLDIYIGLPFSENYRTAKLEQLFFSGLEDWNSLLFDGGWFAFYSAIFPANKTRPVGRIFSDLTTPSFLHGSWMFGHQGMGGQMVYGDLDHNMGLAFLTNRMYAGLYAIYSPQFKVMLKATYDVVKNLK